MKKKQKNVRTKTDKNLYNFDYVSKEEQKQKEKKQKAKKVADAKSASNKSKKKKKSEVGQADTRKKYEDEIIIGVTTFPEKEKNEKKQQPKKTNKKKKPSNNINNSCDTNNTEHKSKKTHKNLVKVVILTIIISVAIIFAMLSPMFNVTNIKISGNNIVSSDEIKSISQIYLGENIFRIGKSKIISNIKQNAYINKVTISKELPNIVEITVEERQPTYMLEYGNGYVYLNNQGYMLEINSTKKEIPVLKGISTSQEEYKAGNRLNDDDLKKLGTVIKIMSVAEIKEISKLITSIDIQDTSDYAVYFDTEEKVAYLGDCTDIETRMLFVAKILTSEKDIPGEIYVNMNLNTDYVFFREKV